MNNLTKKEINGIPYDIHTTARTRKILITINEKGEVLVSKPARVSIAHIEKLVAEKFDWITSKIDEQASRPKKLLGHYSPKDYEANKERARKLAHDRLAHFNAFYKHRIGKVSIRNQSSRWGSCTSHGNLNFNYKIALLPPELADYIIVHELCHLREMNHGEPFWNLVSQQIPNYKKLRTEIRAY